MFWPATSWLLEWDLSKSHRSWYTYIFRGIAWQDTLILGSMEQMAYQNNLQTFQFFQVSFIIACWLNSCSSFPLSRYFKESVQGKIKFRFSISSEFPALCLSMVQECSRLLIWLILFPCPKAIFFTGLILPMKIIQQWTLESTAEAAALWGEAKIAVAVYWGEKDERRCNRGLQNCKGNG